ncbi:hypothetical protein [Pyrobaculum aerophilum]|nr:MULTISPECIES: hypothetical protein [Pyrobaculum]
MGLYWMRYIKFTNAVELDLNNDSSAICLPFTLSSRSAVVL